MSKAKVTNLTIRRTNFEAHIAECRVCVGDFLREDVKLCAAGMIILAHYVEAVRRQA